MLRLLVLAMLATSACATTSAADSAAAVAHYDLGVSELRQGDTRDALRTLRKAVDADPYMYRAHNALGLVYHALGRLEEALEHYDTAVELKEDFSDAHNNRGILLTDLGRYDEAIEAFEIALNNVLYAFPTHAEANMGWAYYKKGEADRAIRHLRNAVATNPKFCRGYEWLAQIGIETDRPDQAIANVRRFEKHCVADEQIAKQLPDSYRQEMAYYLARGYQEIGDTAQARKGYADCAVRGETAIGLKCVQSLRSLGR
ncbi:MAG: tetratricopeptide repeat protein [Myxococcota bacterium]